MDELKREIKQLIIKSLDLEEMTPADIADDEPLFGDGLGLDSIDALELGIALRKKYGVKFETSDGSARQHFRSVSSLAQFVEENREAGVPDEEDRHDG
jgi:acyl carrier protein